MNLKTLTSRWRNLAAYGVLFLAIAFTYANSLDGALVFDDHSSIDENPHIRKLWPITEPLRSPKQTAIAGRPLVSLTLALNYAISGYETTSYHLFNILIHLLSAFLIFNLLKRHLSNEQPHCTTLPLIITFLWALHPLQTESITYIVQRTELLGSFFILLTLFCFAQAASTPKTKAHYFWLSSSIVSCLAGMAAKEIVAVCPLLVLLYDRIFVTTSFKQIISRRWFYYLILFFCVSSITALGLHYGSRSYSVGFDFVKLSAWTYARTQVSVILHYLRLVLWPEPLVVDYEDWPIASGSLLSQAPSIFALLLLLIASVWLLIKHPRLGFFAASFWILLAPSSSFVPIVTEIAAERRMYLPLLAPLSIGFITCHYWLTKNWPQQKLVQIIEAGLVIIIGALYISLSMLRNLDYRSEFSLWTDTVAKRPSNARAHNNLGLQYALRNKPDLALVHFNRVIELQPQNAAAFCNLGNFLATQGDAQAAETKYRQAILADDRYAEAHSNLGITLARRGEFATAFKHFLRAIKLEPSSALFHANFGQALLLAGNKSAAVEELRKAQKLAAPGSEIKQQLESILVNLRKENNR